MVPFSWQPLRSAAARGAASTPRRSMRTVGGPWRSRGGRAIRTREAGAAVCSLDRNREIYPPGETLDFLGKWKLLVRVSLDRTVVFFGGVWLEKLKGQTAGFGPCFHLPGFHFGTGFLSHSQITTRSPSSAVSH